MTTWDDRTLSTQCEAIREGAAAALDWIAGVRGNSQRLDREADGLNEKLYRSSNLCRRLGAAAQRPFSAGVFGMSQAGKSFLISTLARPVNGELETVLDGKRVRFIGQLNPTGEGKEATGLVTRFTRKPGAAPPGHPVELTLFSEADVVKILGNSFFNDFDRERVSFDTDPERLKALLARAAQHRTAAANPGLTSADIVDLIDYFERRFEKSVAPLRSEYWPKAIDLVPHLRPEHRAELLGVLWGGIPDLTQAYLTLRGTLEQLSHAGVVFVPLQALVSENEADGRITYRPDSILNVDVLNRLGKDSADVIGVRPQRDGEALPVVPIPRSVLAALTAEIRFVLGDAPAMELLEEVDLLDFPGYRGRLRVSNLDEVRQQLNSDSADPVAQLLLRAKVAYLFERYTEDQEMNVLLMCTRCDSQIEVQDLAPALSSWVHSTQGENPALREKRSPGLVWVITQIDRRLALQPGQTVEQYRERWGHMVHTTMLERFSQCEWLNNWASEKPFDNVFLVRKPGHLASVFVTDPDGREADYVSAEEQQRLRDQRDYFVADEKVARHIREPVAAWDAVLGINEGGMTRLADYLRSVCKLASKWERIGEQVTKIRQEIGEHRLLPYFQSEGAGEVEKKRRSAEHLYEAVEASPDGFGELLNRLQPDGEQLRRLYLATENGSGDVADEAATQMAPTRKRLINLPIKKAAETAQPVERSGRAERFAKAAVSAWIRQLRALPDGADVLNYLALPGDAARIVTDELVTGLDRHQFEQQLLAALKPLEDMRGTTRIGIVDQQVMVVRQMLGNFLALLGVAESPMEQRPESPLGGRRVFEPPSAIPPGALPDLPDEELSYSGAYVMDWLEAFKSLAIGNAGHRAGREITPEQNVRLGEILALFGVPGTA